MVQYHRAALASHKPSLGVATDQQIGSASTSGEDTWALGIQWQVVVVFMGCRLFSIAMSTTSKNGKIGGGVDDHVNSRDNNV